MSKALTAQERMAQVAPEATPIADLPEVLNLKLEEVEGQGSRAKFTGQTDEAGTVLVSLYFPEGASIPKTMTLKVAGKGYDRFRSVVKPNRKGSVKWAFGNLADGNKFGAAAFVPAKAATHTIKVKLGA